MDSSEQVQLLIERRALIINFIFRIVLVILHSETHLLKVEVHDDSVVHFLHDGLEPPLERVLSPLEKADQFL